MLFLRFQREMFKSLFAMLNDEGSRVIVVCNFRVNCLQECAICFAECLKPARHHSQLTFRAHEERRENVSRLISRASVSLTHLISSRQTTNWSRNRKRAIGLFFMILLKCVKDYEVPLNRIISARYSLLNASTRRQCNTKQKSLQND